MYDLDIVSVTYGHNHELRCFVESILSQSSHNWRLHLIHDGPGPEFIRIMNQYWGDTRINYFCTETRANDWGHSLRALGLSTIQEKDSRYVLFTNADNIYVPVFVEEMTKACSDIVYCNMIHDHWDYRFRETSLQRGKIDCSAFVVKTELAKKVGWNSREYAADWYYIQDVLRAYPNASVIKNNKILVVHN